VTYVIVCKASGKSIEADCSVLLLLQRRERGAERLVSVTVETYEEIQYVNPHWSRPTRNGLHGNNEVDWSKEIVESSNRSIWNAEKS